MADFIGESTILNGRMIRDRRVEFMGHEFDCVDEGFGENVPVDVVVRPEDVIISAKTEGSQFTGVVQSCIFKGVHYEMFVDTDKGYELMVQDYDQFEPGSTVGLSINPEDIQVMHKERTCNTFDAEVIDSSHVLMLDEEWECEVPEGAAPGDILKAEVDFSEVDLLDHQDEGKLAGEVHFLLYKGDHYHLTVKTEDGDFIYVDTDDIWDKGDLVGIDMLPGGIKLSRKDDKAQ